MLTFIKKALQRLLDFAVFIALLILSVCIILFVLSAPEPAKGISLFSSAAVVLFLVFLYLARRVP